VLWHILFIYYFSSYPIRPLFDLLSSPQTIIIIIIIITTTTTMTLTDPAASPTSAQSDPTTFTKV
jgi:hypothetical protein